MYVQIQFLLYLLFYHFSVGSFQIYAESWFLDEVWVGSARPCWVEKVKFKYNTHQGGYLLSIDQGDKINRPVDDVFLCNPNMEVIKRGGMLPEAFEFGTGKMMNGSAASSFEETNGYFKR